MNTILKGAVNYQTVLGAILIVKRKALGLNQADLAKSVNHHVSSLIRWERGTTCPNMTELKMITEFLGIDLVTLITEVESFAYGYLSLHNITILVNPREKVLDEGSLLLDSKTVESLYKSYMSKPV